MWQPLPPPIDCFSRIAGHFFQESRKADYIGRFDEGACHSILNELGKSADPRSDNRRADSMRFNSCRRPSFKAARWETSDVPSTEQFGDFFGLNAFVDDHPRIIAELRFQHGDDPTIVV